MSSQRSYLIALNSAVTHLMRRIRRVDESQKVGRAKLSALAVLHFGGPCTLSELANSELVSKATMHHVIRGLEDQGLVVRSVDEQDGRRQLVELTTLGKATITRAHQDRIDYLVDLAKDVSIKDLTTTVRTLEVLRDNAALIAGTERP